MGARISFSMVSMADCNGTDPGGHPVGFAAADLTYLSEDLTNCFADNDYETEFWFGLPLSLLQCQ